MDFPFLASRADLALDRRCLWDIATAHCLSVLVGVFRKPMADADDVIDGTVF